MVEHLIALYEAAIKQIEKNFETYARTGKKPGKHPVYPYLGVEVESVPHTTTLAYGKVPRPGFYGTTITNPRLFRDYLIEQLTLLMQNSKAEVFVGKSRTAIPLTFAVERAASAMSAEQRIEQDPGGDAGDEKIRYRRGMAQPGHRRAAGGQGPPCVSSSGGHGAAIARRLPC